MDHSAAWSVGGDVLRVYVQLHPVAGVAGTLVVRDDVAASGQRCNSSLGSVGHAGNSIPLDGNIGGCERAADFYELFTTAAKSQKIDSCPVDRRTFLRFVDTAGHYPEVMAIQRALELSRAAGAETAEDRVARTGGKQQNDW